MLNTYILVKIMISKRLIITFLSILSLPLLHNLYFWNQPVIFTKTWNTYRTLIVDEYNLNNFIDNVFYTLSLNIDFIFMNPFEVNVFDRVGRLLPMIFFLNSWAHYLISYLKKHFKYKFFYICLNN